MENAMKLVFTPILANGMIMIWVEMLWAATTLVAGILALLALTLGIVPPAGKRPGRLAVVSLVLSFAPFLVLLAYSGPVSSYGSAKAPMYVMVSLVPVVLSATSVWLTRRAPPGDPRP
jgi:hypothetical protein